jgi:hypothetical protein
MAKHILDRWQGYTVADCDCRYCLHYGGKRQGEVICLSDECVCKKELREALIRERRSFNGSKNQ